MGNTIEALKNFEKENNQYIAQLKAEIYRSGDEEKIKLFNNRLRAYDSIKNQIVSEANAFNQEIALKVDIQKHETTIKKIKQPSQLTGALKTIKENYKNKIENHVEANHSNKIIRQFDLLQKTQASIVKDFPELSEIPAPKYGKSCRSFTDEAFPKDAENTIKSFNQHMESAAREQNNNIMKGNEARVKAQKEAEQKARKETEEKARNEAEKSKKIAQLNKEKETLIREKQTLDQKVKAKQVEIAKLEKNLKFMQRDQKDTSNDLNYFQKQKKSITSTFQRIENSSEKSTSSKNKHAKKQEQVNLRKTPFHHELAIKLAEVNNHIKETLSSLATLKNDIHDIHTQKLPKLDHELKSLKVQRREHSEHAENRIKNIDSEIAKLSNSKTSQVPSNRLSFLGASALTLMRTSSESNLLSNESRNNDPSSSGPRSPK